MFKSLSTVGSFTLLSRILGFLRDMVFAQVFGAGAMTDAFFVAFKIPNFLRRLFAEGAFSVAFVPVLTEYREKRSFAELKGFVDHVAGTLGAVLFAVVVIGMLGAPAVVALFAPGFIGDEVQFPLAVEMLRLTFPYILFISLVAFAGGIMNAHGRFAAPAFTPVLLNLSLIGCALWLAPRLDQPVVALAWGVLLAGVLQFLFQLPWLARLKLLPTFRPAPRDAGVRRILRLMLPALFGISVTQLNLLLDTLIASFLAAGSISWLYYSDRLMEFPVGILGVALGTVVLPKLSQQHAAESPEAFSRTLDWALRNVVLFAAPAAVGLILLAGPMIATLFQSAEFNINDIEMSTRSLVAYSLGLFGFVAIKVLAPGFYARQDTRTPVRIAVIAMLTNMVMNLVLVWPLRHAGLAAATSISALVNAGLLLHHLRGQQIYTPGEGWRATGLRVGAGLLVMAALLLLLVGDLSDWLAMGRLARVWKLAWLIMLAGGAYFVTLFALGVRKRDFLRG
ncbi:MAG TPA: murein biosynthesis integral membrane protein MurJ [Chromatiaceae bacterium]|nr:murein biosynthesis integral membrane protein MurJ [Chromatiaceae bacterium]